MTFVGRFADESLEAGDGEAVHSLICKSMAMRDGMRRIGHAARVDSPVFIGGGVVGLANALHNRKEHRRDSVLPRTGF